VTNYGVQPTGYVRKPISVILAELEAAMITEFGPGVLQTSQTPLGQLNGLMADLLAEIDERNLDLYQSYDPDQAENTRLDTLARLRLVSRGGLSDPQLRQAITNQGQARVDIQDLNQALSGIAGVTYVKVFVNETGEIDPELDSGLVSIAVLGGDDQEIADAIRRYIVPGVTTYGNTYITSQIDGFCRSVSVIRPINIIVNLDVAVQMKRDRFGCPPPSQAAIKQLIETGWDTDKINGLDPSFYTIRAIVERALTNVEVISVQGSRDGITYGVNEPVPINFIEMASVVATLDVVG